MTRKPSFRKFDITRGQVTAPPIPKHVFKGALVGMLDTGAITRADAIRLLEVMLTIRRFESVIVELKDGKYRNPEVKYRGASHLCLGQEACEAPIALVLTDQDFIASNHRGHGHSIAKGTDVNCMMAEMFGRACGACKGKGGSMHIAEFEKCHLGANGVVGGGFPIAGGAALGAKLAGTGRIVFCFAGDGATNTGSFHEALNMASQLRVPCLFAIEDNGAGMTGRLDEVTNVDELVRRAWAYGIPGEVVDGMDVIACLEAYRRAAKILRDGGGPLLYVFKTIRYKGHSLSDDCRSYRTEEEEKEWMARDAIASYEAQVLRSGAMTQAEIDALHRKVEAKIDAAVEHAWKSPEPAVETLVEDVYANTLDAEAQKIPVLAAAPAEAKRKLTTRDAITEALAQAMEADKRVVVFGEDVAAYGGAFGATTGLVQRFGPTRVWNAPISENAIVGFGLGAGMSGLLRPVVEIMYNDFLAQAEDQLQNQSAKARYMYGGKALPRFVVRTTIGGGKGYSCQHGQELVSKYANLPGLRIAVPATPFDAKGLLMEAIYMDDPVIFFEHQLLYGTSTIGAMVPETPYRIPFGKAAVLKEGKDVTVWAYSRMLHSAWNAARKLERSGIACEVIDPRTISPLDLETVVASVRKTGRLVAVSQGTDTGNIVHTLVSKVMAALGGGFRAVTVTAPDGVMPMAENLEAAFIPSATRIEEAIVKIAKG
ncbi:MAG TPA: thiamine pyrophosphate-dependent enzyme [Planctomycetota bacterium]|nr:thiamine pyrophosphate-dependent enzyme [Planctomycetota bacterium]